jgi:6,7-dimethyl-8-ribityllumazine synthase (EC 2.5.1.9)
MKEIKAKMNGNNQSVKIAIVVSRFNDFITERLLTGAVESLTSHGVDENNITVYWVPGAFEIPQAAKAIAQSGKVDAVVALGCVIRGATAHFVIRCGECNSGLTSVAMNHDVIVTNGVLTLDTLEQAIERAGSKAGNKGSEAALTALEMIDILKHV